MATTGKSKWKAAKTNVLSASRTATATTGLSFLKDTIFLIKDSLIYTAFHDLSHYT